MLRSIIRLAIFLTALAIGNNATVLTNPVNSPHSTAITTHSEAQPADAEILECSAERNDSGKRRWACTCNLYSDRRKWGGIGRGKHKGQWQGTVRSEHVRWVAEIHANNVCENATKDIDCKECTCRRRGPF